MPGRHRGRRERAAELKAAAAPALPVIARLAQAARKAGTRVVHLTYVPAFGGLSTNKVTPLQQAIGPLNAGGRPSAAATWSTRSAWRRATSCCKGRRYVAHAQHGAVRGAAQYRRAHVVLVGVSLNVAIPSATVELGDEGFSVVIPRDGVAGTPTEYGDSVLRNTLRFLATITTADHVIGAWS